MVATFHKNILLSLAPIVLTDIPNEFQHKGAKSDEIIDIIHELIKKSHREWRLAISYCSGHGLGVRENNIEYDAMIGAICNADHPNKTLSNSSVTDYLATYHFKIQLFFIDACRDVPCPFEFRIGHWPRAHKRDSRLPPVRQSVFYGTSPGLRSYIAAGSTNSIFTQLLPNAQNAGPATYTDVADCRV
jgi:Caspase domain